MRRRPRFRLTFRTLTVSKTFPTPSSPAVSVATLVQASREQERRQQTLRAELSDLERPRLVTMNVTQLEARLREKSEEWQALLRKQAPIARQMVRKLVEGRIVFTPDRVRRRYTFQAPGTLAWFISGIVCP